MKGCFFLKLHIFLPEGQMIYASSTFHSSGIVQSKTLVPEGILLSFKEGISVAIILRVIS